jgi:phosphate:Na+ symporter
VLVLIGTFIGGLGLFLLAVSMITDGLRLAAGDALRDLLARSTATRPRGILTGAGVTAVVQSSSAVTIATIGFVNAGLLTLPQSLGVLYGANVGTTITGWIVAAVGFSFNVEVFALPLIGVGMLSRMLRPNSRLAAVGEALAGFGLFFIGVDVLKEAFEGFSASVDVTSFAPQGGLGIVVYVLLGFTMTVITQSSSAAIAITLTAATGGLLGLNAAAAMVIGANVGTTSTAALAVVGATPNARRLATAHVLFNLVTGAVALALLPVMLWLVRTTGAAIGLDDVPAVSLALFHTVFNVLGVLLMLPLTGRLVAYLSRKFASESEGLSKPVYLDHNALANPDLAVEALRLELLRATGICREIIAATVSPENRGQNVVAGRRVALRRLIEEIENFVGLLELERLAEGFRGNLPLVLRVTGYLEEVVGLADDIDEHRPDINALVASQTDVTELILGYQAAVLAQVERCDPELASFEDAELEAGYDRLRSQWHTLKDALLQAAADRRVPIKRLNAASEGLRSCLKVVEQLKKATVRQNALETRSAGMQAR